MNVLLIGGGWISGMVYVPFLNSLDFIQHIYIVDVDILETQKRFINFKKVEAISQDDQKNLSYEVVFILSPNFLHYTHLLDFLAKNITIMIEKPICINYKEFRDLKSKIIDINANIYVSTPFRYRKDMMAIKDIISSKKLGNVYHVEMNWLKRRGTPGSAWFVQKTKSGGGVLMDMGPHLLDLFYWFFGERTASTCLGTMSSVFLNSGDAYADWHKRKDNNIMHDVEDSSFSHLVYDSMSLSLNLAWASNIKNDYAQIKVFGSQSTLEVLTSIGFSTNTLYKNTILNITKNGKTKTKTILIEDRKEPFYKMLVDLSSGTKKSLANASSALHVMQDIFNIYDNSSHIIG